MNILVLPSLSLIQLQSPSDSTNRSSRALANNLNLPFLLQTPQGLCKLRTLYLDRTRVVKLAVDVRVASSVAGTDIGIVVEDRQDAAFEILFASAVRCAAAFAEQAHVDEACSGVGCGGFDGAFDQSDCFVDVAFFDRWA